MADQVDEIPNRLLVVENNPSQLDALRRNLRALGWPTLLEHVETLDEALDRLSTSRPDAVVIDVDLPSRGGLAAIEEIVASANSIPVLVLTDEDESAAHAMLHAGAQDFLYKNQLTAAALRRALSFAVQRTKYTRRLAEMARRLEEANRRLLDLATRDPLTQVLNRRGLQIQLDRESSRGLRTDTALVALLVDVDDFKAVNTAIGHQGGDIVLKQVANAIVSTVRPSDIVGRIGGDEFLVVLPDTRLAEARKVSQRVLNCIAGAPMPPLPNMDAITVSVGIAVLPAGHVEVEDILAGAGSPLAIAKDQGKNRVVTGGYHAVGTTSTPEEPQVLSGVAIWRPIQRLGDRRTVARQLRLGSISSAVDNALILSPQEHG
ncbi:MAG: diguanylate cyclase, partial [Myxococcales bacterium]|nr:diguanylate cyclase [Myxococcales bacterium]